jgi:hypothetical protein
VYITNKCYRGLSVSHVTLSRKRPGPAADDSRERIAVFQRHKRRVHNLRHISSARPSCVLPAVPAAKCSSSSQQHVADEKGKVRPSVKMYITDSHPRAAAPPLTASRLVIHPHRVPGCCRSCAGRRTTRPSACLLARRAADQLFVPRQMTSELCAVQIRRDPGTRQPDGTWYR